jgi:mannan endo-1,4-beta-mannosidase
MRFHVVLITLFLPLSFAISRAATANLPADLQLNSTGHAILGYIQQLQANPDFKILSGQFCNYGPDARLEAPEKIFQTTGRWPAMIAVDYTDFKNKWIDTRTPNRLLIDYWRAGGLCSVSVHLNNPSYADGGGLKETGLNIADILVPNTPVHDRWIRQLDEIAAGLQELQTAGVVVLWRPFHEMNGHWFWWGAQKPADFIKVWRHMFTYFTQTKRLHNLIWVYGPNHGQHIADYYPGDNFADLVGLDAYTDNIDPDHIKGYKELVALKKPFGFTEYGPHGASDPTGDFDFRRFPTGLAKHFPQTRFFLSWNAKWNPAENKFAREFYNDPRVITRDDLPAMLTAQDYAGSLQNWRMERLARLTKADGWLTLVGRHQIQAGENSLGTAQDNSIKLAIGPAYLGTINFSPGKVLFTPAPGAILQIDGRSALPSELSYKEENPTHVTFGTASFHVIERGGSLFLRVKDGASDRLKDFVGIDYFATDVSWRIEAEWVPFDPPHQVNITNMLGQTAPALVPGKAVFKRDGHTFELLPIDEGDDELFFVFTDLTAGEETYEASRFLYTEKPKDGKLILDFNRAQNPPCAFTPFATCPLPPKGNSLQIRVTAGEKKYRGRHD